MRGRRTAVFWPENAGLSHALELVLNGEKLVLRSHSPKNRAIRGNANDRPRTVARCINRIQLGGRFRGHNATLDFVPFTGQEARYRDGTTLASIAEAGLASAKPGPRHQVGIGTRSAEP
jgi:hypothetical protein